MIRRRRVVTLTIIVVVLLLAALGAGWFPQEPLRRVLEQQLAQVVAAPGTGGGARVGRLSVVPALLKAELEDLELEGSGFRVSIPRLRIQLAPAALTGELDIKRLELDSPTLEFWDAPGESSSAGGSFPRLRIGDLQLTDGTLRYRSAALPGEIELRGVAARGSAGPGTLSLEAASGVLSGESPLALGPARAELTVSPAMELRLDALELTTAGSRFRAAGDLGPAGALAPRLEWEAAVDLAEIAPFAKRDLSGGVDAKGHLSVAQGRVRIEGEITGAGLNADGWSVDQMHARVETAGPDADAMIDLALLGGRSEAQARLRGGQVEAQIHVADLDIARLGRRLSPESVPLDGRLTGDMWLAGSADGILQSHGTLSGSGRAEGFSVSGRASFDGPLNLSDGSIGLTWSLEARADRSAEDDAATPRVRSGMLRASGTFQGPEPAARASLDASLVLDAAAGPLELPVGGTVRYEKGEVAAELAAGFVGGTLNASVQTGDAALRRLQVKGEGLQLSQLLGETRGVLSFSAEGSGPLDRLSGSADLRIDEAGWQAFAMGAVVGSIDASGGRGTLFIEVPELRLGARGQWQARPTPVVRATLSLEESPLAPLQTLLPEGIPFDGTLTGTVELDVPIDRVADTVVQARIDDLVAGSGDLVARTTQAFSAALRDGTLQIEGLRLEGEGFRLDASGRLGTEPDAPIDVELGLNVALADLPGLEEWALSGQIGVDAQVRGPLREPAASGWIRLTDAGAQVAGLPRLLIPDGRLELVGSALAIPELRADFADGSITAAGRIPLAAVLRAARAGPELAQGAEQAELRLEWAGLDAGRLIEALQPEGATALGGALQGRLELRGGLLALDELRGRVELARTTLSVQDQSLELSPAQVEIVGGRLSTEELAVTAEGGTFRVAGSVDLVDRVLDLTGKGSLHLRALSPFLAEASLSGEAETDISVSGPFDAPTPRGTLQVRGATLRIRDIPQAITDVNGLVIFDAGGLRIEPTTGSLGGGSLTLTGTASLEGAALGNLALALKGQDVILRYPEGLRSRLNADLELAGKPGALQLHGKVQALRGVYDLELALETSLLAKVVEVAPSPLLRSIGLDIEIETLGPVMVRNNLADLQAGGRLVIRGDMESPAPLGRLEIDPGGKLLLQGREFVIESGRLAYGGTWDPTVAIQATTAIATPDFQNFRVTVTASGSLEQPRLAFSSSPSLTEREIVSLIVTGRTSSEALSSSAWVAGEQAATFLTSRLSRDVTRALQDFGIDEVSIQPELIARETDPGARFTFGKRLGQRMKLIYSQSLKDAEGRFIRLEGYPGLDATLLGQRQDDGSLTFGGGQRLSLGGPTSRESEDTEAPTRLSAVRFDGDIGLDEETLRAAVRARPDRKLTPWKLQEDAERLRTKLREDGHLEAEVGARLEGDVALFQVRAGPRYSWRVAGMNDPPDLEPQIAAALFEEEALQKGRERLLETLHDRGLFRASVETRAVLEAGDRRLVFDVDPGPRLELAEARFPGAQLLSTKRLLAVAGGPAAFVTDPEAAVAGVRDAYLKQHHLGVEVDRPRVEVRSGRVFIEMPIREGSPAKIVGVRFEGTSRPAAELSRIAALEVGTDYAEVKALAAAGRVRDHYYGQGYPGVRVTPDLVPEGADLAVLFEIVEGERVEVGEIEIEGLSRTRESLARGRLGLEAGDPVDPREVARAERRLLDLGTFSRAALTVLPEQSGLVRVEVEETAPVVASYQIRYNDDRGMRGELESELRNLLGRGLSLGGRYSRGSKEEEIRGSLHVPAVLGSGNLTGSAFHFWEDLEAIDPLTGEPIANRRLQRGFELFLSQPVWDRLQLQYGYRFRRSQDSFVEPFNSAAVELSMLRETRDNPINPSRGSFLSLALELAPEQVGSDLDYVKGVAQAFLTKRLAPALTWAQGYRAGLAHVFSGEPLLSFDRFKAGGSNSVRGFATDSLGPSDFFGDPRGGQAMLIFNQELRYRHATGVGAVLFWDAGNVFAKTRDVSLDLRHALGTGLRWDSPVGLLRLDVGFPLARREGEKAYRLYFSLGQAF